MDEVFVIVYLILGGVLRIGIPIGITFLLGWSLRRMDARWRQEAVEAETQGQIAQLNIWLSNPCWKSNNCSSKTRAKCSAYQQRERPCWEVYRANGTLTQECRECIYRQELPIPVGTSI